MVWVGVPKYHPVEYTFENDLGYGNSEDITNLSGKVYAGDNPAVIYAEDLSCNYNPIDGQTVIGPIFTIHHPKIKGYRFEDVGFINETKADINYSPKCIEFSADRMTSQWRFFFDGADDYNGAFENKIKGSEDDPIRIHFKYQEARTVSLNGNGGTVDNVNESILVYKYRINRGSNWYEDDGRYGYAFDFSQHTPVRSGYEFTGWYADKACTKLVIAADSANMNSDFKKYINANNIFQKEGSENCSENFDMYAGWKQIGATPTPTPKPASGFSDVQNPKHPYYNAIYWAANAGITKGYPDGTFGIDKNCTRGEMMMFLWRYAGKKEPKAVSKTPFKDVPKTHTFYKAILWGSQKGITKGYSDGTFGVNRNVTRGECMMFLWRLKGKPAPKAVAKAPFPDVPKNHVFYNAVLWGFQKKITTGFTSGELKGKFGVDANCSRGQIVTFLYRAR
ncbi:MAG: S-layer homology domain-containing protein [Lachnospiraceae bacterium]|nr:S-layer homology domain-containing protein [Lachnospiraceae bacterium]